jgi:hypothetical protein
VDAAIRARTAAIPNAAHDDQVDVTAYAAKVLSERVHAPRREKPPAPIPGTVNVQAILRRRKEKLREQQGRGGTW